MGDAALLTILLRGLTNNNLPKITDSLVANYQLRLQVIYSIGGSQAPNESQIPTHIGGYPHNLNNVSAQQTIK